MTIFTKQNVEESEYLLQKKAYDNNVPTPRPISYNKDTRVLKMEKCHGLSVADMYGDNDKGLKELIERGIMKSIKVIVEKLKDIGIFYPDVTGYNFMIDENSGEICVIDFGHAFELSMAQCSHINFVQTFLSDKHINWNADFR
tara:strand:- start:33 stop:461 length:429 start_codon:yes stop_codon:yes gene_type:complete